MRIVVAAIAIVFVTAATIPAFVHAQGWWILEPGATKWYVDGLRPEWQLNVWVGEADSGMTDLHLDYYSNGQYFTGGLMKGSVDQDGDFWWHLDGGEYFRRIDDHSIRNPLCVIDVPLWVGKAWADTIYKPHTGYDYIYEFTCADELDIMVPLDTYHVYEIRYEVYRYFGGEWLRHCIERKFHNEEAGLIQLVTEGCPWTDMHYELTDFTVGVSVPSSRPISITNHPNPFNPQTTISFSLERDEWAEVGVYELTGKQVTVLVDQTLMAGSHSYIWNGRDARGRAMPSGTYVIRLETEAGVQSRKVMLVR